MKRSRIALTAGLILVVLIGGGLAGHALLQIREARSLAIRSPDGIDEAGFVDIRGAPQWVQIRGEHRSNPVILVVHGGPGFAMSPLTRLFRPWERDFTLVQWDQRDAGLTFSRNGAQPLSLDQAAADGVAVVEDVRRRLPGARVVLLGHSWGSAVGLEMIRRRPDLFAAFVGAGQMSDKPEQEALSYRRVMQRLVSAGNRKGAQELAASGPPPYPSMVQLLTERKWLAAVDTPAERSMFADLTPQLLLASRMSLLDDWRYMAAAKIAQAAAFHESMDFEAARLGPDFRVPIFVIEGDQDLYTPAEPTARWLAGVHAPAKDLILLKGGGHDALLTMPDAFLRLMRNAVKPRLPAASGVGPQ
jgi:pimeloyl-ACP methyl ester carboxylesterase